MNKINCESGLARYLQAYRVCTNARPLLARDINTVNWRYTIRMTLMMISAQVVETSVNVTSNSPSWDYSHPDDQTTQTI